MSKHDGPASERPLVTEILQRERREAPPDAPAPDGRRPRPRGPRAPVTTWGDLEAELDKWAAAGRTATLWWRDDDAGAPTGALEVLLGLARDSGVPVALLATPALASAPGQGQPLTRLAAEIALFAEVRVLQYGYEGINRAQAGLPPAELAGGPAVATLRDALADGAFRLHQMFGDQAVPVLAPPWQRIDPALVAELPGIGLRGLTGLGPRGTRRHVGPDGTAVHLIQANAHISLSRLSAQPDAVARAPFVGTDVALERLVTTLRARRHGTIDPLEPTGIVTHYQRMESRAWDFLAELVTVTRAHTAASWLPPERVFALTR